MKKIKFFLAFLLLLNYHDLFSQTDKEFWFAVPNATSQHADRPIYLRMSTTSLASTVTISIPANPNRTPATVNIPANSTVTYDLTGWIDDLENVDANQVLNKGLHIVATNNITVYYELLGMPTGTTDVRNSDIFPLKGSNALGTDFYTPFQNQLNNEPSVDAWSSFDIVATEDNTTITITPTQDIVGHTAVAGSFTITLNKGQTYSARATSKAGANHPTGSHITSNKPIAVTIKDDSVVQNGGWDMVGDQLVPVSMLGTEYIVVRGFLNTSGASLGDRAIIVATQNNTTINIGGVVVATINAGQTYNYQITDGAAYIKTSNPAYVLHLSGFGDELGGGILPTITCTGSKQVGLIRDTNDPFYLNILVQGGGESNFTIKNSTTGITNVIPAASFSNVPGTAIAGEWKFARIQYNTTDFPSGSVGLVSNSTHLFHVGLINGNATGSACRYGYFSDFGSITGGTATATTPVCYNTSSVINLEGSSGNIQWQQSADGTNGWTNVTTGTGATTTKYTTPALTAKTFYRAVLSSGTCIPVYSNTVAVAIDPVSVGGTATAGTSPVCSGSTSTLTVSGHTGSVQWQQSTDNSSWTNVSGGSGATSATYTTPALTSTTYYRAQVTSGVCSSVNSSSATVTVNPTSVGGTTTTGTSPVCEGSTSTLTVSGYTGAIQWQQSPDGSSWTNVTGGSGATSSTYTTPALTTTTSYRAVITSGVCSSVNSSATIVTVSPTSVGGTATAATTPVCSGSTSTLTVSGHTGAIQWQQSTDGSNWINVTGGSGATSATYTTPVLTTTTYYRAQVTSGVCSTVSSSIATVTVNPTSVGGTTTVGTSPICSGSTSTLTVSGHTGAIQWQQSADGSSWTNVTGGSGATSATYTTPALTTTTSYRAMVTSGVCSSVNSSSATVTVNPVSVGGTASATASTICAGTTSTVTVSGYTGTIQWQDSLSGQNWKSITGATNPSYSTGNLSQTTYYRALIKSGVCPQTTSDTALVTVNSVSKGGTTSVSNAIICSGGTTTINLSGYNGSVQWQQSADGITGWTDINGATSASYTTPSLTQTTYYRAIVKNGVCSQSISDNAKVTVNPLSAVGTATTGTSPICYGNTSSVSLSGYTGNIKWEQSDNGTSGWTNVSGGSGATSATYTTPSLTQTTYYRATITSGVCTSTNSNIVSIVVDSLSMGGTSATSTSPICSGNTSTVKLSGYRGDIQWQQSMNGISGWTNVSGGQGSDSPVFTTQPLTATTYFRANVKNGVCSQTSSGITKVSVDSVSAGGIASASSTTICSGTSSTVSLNNGFRGNFIQWQDSVAGGSWNSITAANNPVYVATNLHETTYYRAIIKNGVCAQAVSDTVKVTVNTTSSGGTISLSEATICSGSSAVVTLTGYNGTSIQWQDSVAGGIWKTIKSANNPVYNTPELTQTTYYRAIVKNGVCEQTLSETTKITVDSVSAGGKPVADKSFICSGTKTFLTLNNYRGTSIQWQDSTVSQPWKNIAAAENPALTTQNLLETTYYRAIVKNGVCSITISDTIKVQVDSVSQGGNAIATNTTICEETSTTVSLKGYTGNEVQWQDSLPGTTWNNIADAINGSYNTPNLKKTTFYRAIVKSGVCSKVISDTAVVVVNPLSVAGKITGTTTPVCTQTSTQLTVSGNTGAIQWQQSENGTSGWKNVSGGSGNTTTTYTTPSLTNSTYYRAVIKSGVCSAQNTLPFLVRIDSLSFSENFGLNHKDTIICQGTTILLKATEGYKSYQWQDGSVRNTFQVYTEGIYSVKATSPYNCSVTASVKIGPCGHIFIPNVFTPNADGKNDTFIIQGNLPNSSIVVYNRWGTIVYSKDNYENNWDGSGSTDGVYFYIYKRSGDKTYTGSVEIIR